MRPWPFFPLMCVCFAHVHAQRAPKSPQPRIIEYAEGSRPAASWTIVATPQLVVPEDALSGLFNMSHVMRLSDSVVAIACEESIKLVNRAGTVVRTIGRTGRGPGEFVGGLVEAWRSADTLRGMGGDSRVGVFASNGVLLRTEPRVSLPGGVGWSRVGYYVDG